MKSGRCPMTRKSMQYRHCKASGERRKKREEKKERREERRIEGQRDRGIEETKDQREREGRQYSSPP